MSASNYRNAGCDVTIDYKTKWSDFIKPSPLDSTFALIQKFWDSQRVEMQQCELTRSMNPLNQLIADCVQKKIPDFKLPESMPEPAMPPADMMKSEFPLV